MTQDQQVDVMGTLVSHDRFEVHHVAHDRVLTKELTQILGFEKNLWKLWSRHKSYDHKLFYEEAIFK